MRVGHGGLGGRRLRPSGVAKIVFVHPIVLIILLFLFLFVVGGGGVPRLRREDLFVVILFILPLVVLELRFVLGLRFGLGLRFRLFRLALLRLQRERHRLAMLRPFPFRRPRVMSRAELAHAVGLLGVARCRGGGRGQGGGAVVD